MNSLREFNCDISGMRRWGQKWRPSCESREKGVNAGAVRCPTAWKVGTRDTSAWVRHTGLIYGKKVNPCGRPRPAPHGASPGSRGTMMAGETPADVWTLGLRPPASTSAAATSPPARGRSRCAPPAAAVPAAARMRRRSAAGETDWPRSASNWCGRFPARGVL